MAEYNPSIPLPQPKPSEGFERVRRNVQKMIGQQAPESDIDGYLQSEGFTPESFKQNVNLLRAGPTKANAATLEQQQAAAMRQGQGAKGTVFEQPPILDPNAKGGGNLRENPSTPGVRATGALGNYVDSAMLGGADELMAAVKSIPAFLQETIGRRDGPGVMPQQPSTGAAFNQELSRLEQARNDYNALNTPEGTGANVAGIVGSPANVLGGEFIAGAPTTLGRMGRGALLGGGTGAVAGGLSTQGSLEDRAKGAGIGAGIGLTAGGALPLMGAISAPMVRPEVAALRARGVNLTPGQILGGFANQTEEKLGTVLPGLGDMITGARQRSLSDFNRAVYNEVLQPLGLQVAPDVPVGREGIRTVHQAIGDHYDQLLQNVNFVVDQQLVGDIQQVTQIANRLPPQQRERFNQIIQDKIEDRLQQNGGMLNGDAYKAMESELSNDVRGYTQSASHDERSLGEALGDVVGALRDSLGRNNPMYAPQLQATNAAFARLVRLEGAAGSVGNDMGAFTPQQFQHAVKAADSSSRKNAFAQGNALMQELSDAGRAVLPNKFPNSGTPGRMAAAAVAGGGLGMISPTALGVSALAAIPYTSLGGRAVQALMTHQGPRSQATRRLIERLFMPAAIGGGQVGGAIATPPGAR